MFDLNQLVAREAALCGPIIVVGDALAEELCRDLVGNGERELYFLASSVPAAVELQARLANDGPIIIPSTLAEFFAALPVCPSLVCWLSPEAGGSFATAVRALTEFGAVGTRIAGVPTGSVKPDSDFRVLTDGTWELTRVNGRRPAGLGVEESSRLAKLLSAVLATETNPLELRRSIAAVLGEMRSTLLRRQPNPRAWPFAGVEAPLPPTMPDGRPWPRVSVVTPSFRQGRYLEENILSVLRQNYPHIEHIVCDGGSRDETLAVLQRYDAHLASWVSEKDNGQSHALNKGFGRATGEIVTWLNSDDMFAPGALAAAVVALMTTGADMVAGIVEVYHDGRLDSRHLTSCGDGPLPLGDLLNLDDCWLRGQFFYQPEVLFTRALWDRAGGRVREDLHYSMDYELWLRMAQAGAVLTTIGTPIALFRKHDEQKTFLTESYEPELRALRDAFAAEHGLAVVAPSPIEETRRLKVVCFNDNGFRFGAGIGHRRLVDALQICGHHVTCFGAKDVLRGADPLSPAQVAERLLAGNPDVVLLGNIHGTSLSADFVALLAERCPTVFYMHDYWLITGRCAYMEGCEKYLEGCDETCHLSASAYPPLAPEKIHDAWLAKRRLHFGATPVQIATNSRAVAGVVNTYLARQGVDTHAAVVNLPLPLDALHPLDRATCRRLLGIPADAFLVLFSSGRLDDPRKGVDLLLAAIEQTGIPNLLLGCLGRAESAAQFPGANVHPFGYVNEPEHLAQIYSAADVYVGPSRDETFGQVFTEAAACGTPAIGFRVGGVPEAVLDGWSGLVADGISAEQLAQCLSRVWADRALAASLSSLAPIVVRGRFAPEKTANQLHQLLGAALASRGRRLARKLPLTLTKSAQPEVTRIHQGFIRYGTGFERFEPTTRGGKSRKCCWVLGPKADFDLTVETGGRYHLILEYTCPVKQQVLSVRTDTRFLGEFPLDYSPNALRTVELPIFGAVGTQRVTIYPRERIHHQAAGPERTAFRLYGIALIPRKE